MAALLLPPLSLLLASPAPADDARANVPLKDPQAYAMINSCAEEPQFLGVATLREEASEEGVKQVTVVVRILQHNAVLTEGKHAVHLHEAGSCEPANCTDAGGHFDPGPFGMSSPDGNHPFHLGDLINLDVSKHGRGFLRTETSRVTLSPGPLSLFDADGSAVIIHVNPDTYCPQGPVAGCAGGARAACGVIEWAE
jgi:Cu-Zn family superoxide dismutase